MKNNHKSTRVVVTSAEPAHFPTIILENRKQRKKKENRKQIIETKSIEGREYMIQNQEENREQII